eukprot:Nk52_evm4s2462 gene=Nk52_evmTU4s2462
MKNEEKGDKRKIETESQSGFVFRRKKPKAANKQIESLKTSNLPRESSTSSSSSSSLSPVVAFQETLCGSDKNKKKFRRRSSFVNGRSFKKLTLEEENIDLHKALDDKLPLEQQIYDLVNKSLDIVGAAMSREADCSSGKFSAELQSAFGEVVKTTLCSLSDGWKDINDAYSAKYKPQKNPKNVANQEKLESFKSFGKRLENELQSWNMLRDGLETFEKELESSLTPPIVSLSPVSRQYEKLLNPSQINFLKGRPDYGEKHLNLNNQYTSLILTLEKLRAAVLVLKRFHSAANKNSNCLFVSQNNCELEMGTPGDSKSIVRGLIGA